MGKTSNTLKTPPKKKANKAMEYRRSSPRGYKSSSREIEVNTRKRGTGPQGRGGKKISCKQHSSSSSESSELESEEEDEGFDGLCEMKKPKNDDTR